MITQTVGYEQIVALAKTLPEEKLASWYEYGLFIQSRVEEKVSVAADDEEAALAREFAMWDGASDEAWAKVERTLGESL